MSQTASEASVSAADAAVFDLRNRNGLRARVLDYGARLVEMHVPGRDGSLADLVLGFDRPAEYVTNVSTYFGCTVGRVANRTAGASFVLDGTEYRLARNDGRNHLHGGIARSLDRVTWEAHRVDGDGGEGVEFRYTGPHLEEGYPGTLNVSVTYRLSDADELAIDYEATTDRACPVNLTNHSYWNLAGAGSGSILDHELTLFADAYTPVDDELIPTGEIARVDGTVFDFREPTTIGARIATLDATGARGYDHNFVVCGEPGILRPAALLRHAPSGRVMEVRTTEPAIQFYSGNFLRPGAGKGSAVYGHRGGLCLEAQHHPDAVHHPQFPSIILRPGERYTQTTIHRFSIG